MSSWIRELDTAEHAEISIKADIFFIIFFVVPRMRAAEIPAKKNALNIYLFFLWFALAFRIAMSGKQITFFYFLVYARAHAAPASD